MRIINADVEFITPINGKIILKRIEECGRTCYAKGTQILTNNGFKLIEEIDSDDLVLTYNKKLNLLEYQPSNMTKYHYEGKMINSNHLNIKFSVTPDHRMFMSKQSGHNYDFINASELCEGKGKYRIPKHFKNATIKNKDYITNIKIEKEIKHGFRSSTMEKLSITINDDWLIILASYIAEGHTYHGEKYGNGSYVQITQTENTELYNGVINSLNNLGIYYRINQDSRKPYVKWIQFGNQLYVKLFEDLCGHYSKEKHLPNWFRNLSARQMNLLLKYLYLGDGSHNKTRNEKYLSISPQLLEEVQELWILVGKMATSRYNSERSQYCYTEENQRDSWLIDKQKHIFLSDYNDYVYCPSTTNGIVCVQYKGTTFWCGNCYKSEDKITDDSAEKFVENIIKRGHESVLEHCSFTVRFICDRGISHELVRHRIASFSQESTRYCSYDKEKFGNEITVIHPCFFDTHTLDGIKREQIWRTACENAEKAYFEMLANGATPQEARSVLPNSLKTEVVMTANLREWRHFFKLRCSKAAHPQMREVATKLLEKCKEQIPIIFDDIIPD